MAKTIDWPLLGPENIEVKVNSTKDGVTTLLLYQDARCTMDAFDKQFGPMEWQCGYKSVGDQVYGYISVRNPETGEWITKEDTGDKSNFSEDKGQSSDILKRCAVRWGFARELYSAPDITVPCKGEKDYRKFSVKSITYDERRQCSSLVITDGRGNVVFSWAKGQEVPYAAPQQAAPRKANVDILKEFFEKTKRLPGINREELKKFKDYYKDRINEWKNPFNAEEKWNNWMKRAAA